MRAVLTESGPIPYLSRRSTKSEESVLTPRPDSTPSTPSAGYSFPLITDTDFGHTAPQFVLPIGCKVRIDSMNRSTEAIEAAVH
jgi:hypothetical protein